mmetsp:Transcript_83972/g.216138  ORF Transcript_83972/g.216138 Transcript_83972/m.216138 type:complete len:210 (+) Transcript_83972:509-1138(+)
MLEVLQEVSVGNPECAIRRRLEPQEILRLRVLFPGLGSVTPPASPVTLAEGVPHAHQAEDAPLQRDLSAANDGVRPVAEQSALLLLRPVHTTGHGVAALHVLAQHQPEVARADLHALDAEPLRTLPVDRVVCLALPCGDGALPLAGPRLGPTLSRTATAEVQQAIRHGAPLQLLVGRAELGESLLEQRRPNLAIRADAKEGWGAILRGH